MTEQGNMQFKDVIGQQQLKQQFAQAILSGKVAHAQMFLGALGHGGLALALAYAQMLNCENPTENDSCGVCGSCSKIQKLIHPDVHFSYPFPGTIKKDEKIEHAVELMTYWRTMNANSAYFTLQEWMQQFDSENRQPNIPVKECHDIIRRLNLRSFEGKYKVMIIWLPEYLGNEGNTLLKILEEPPDNTVFILVAENPDAMLNTILSRTQLVKINSIDIDELSNYLISNKDVAPQEALNVASLSQGDFIEAQKLLVHESGSSTLLFLQWIEMCLHPNLTANPELLQALIKWIEQFNGIGRENQKNVLRYGLHFFELLFRYKINGDTSLLNEQELDMMKKAEARVDFQKIEKIYTMLNNAHYYFERNANPKILMTAKSLKLSKILNGMEVNLKSEAVA
jgi:DNA polymerase III subunit delta'